MEVNRIKAARADTALQVQFKVLLQRCTNSSNVSHAMPCIYGHAIQGSRAFSSHRLSAGDQFWNHLQPLGQDHKKEGRRKKKESKKRASKTKIQGRVGTY